MVGEEETATEITVEVEYRAGSDICPRCGQSTPKVHSTGIQTKRDRRLWDKPVYLVVRKRRFRCLSCGKVFTEPDPVCGTRRRTSQRFRHHLGQPVRHVARKEGVGEALVRRCVTEEAKRLLEAPEKPPPARVLGLDEFSIRKGQGHRGRLTDTATPRTSDKGLCSLTNHKEVKPKAGGGPSHLLTQNHLTI